MSFDSPVTFEYDDYVGRDDSVAIHWKVTYADGKKIGVITYLVNGELDTSFIKMIVAKGAKYIPYDTSRGDPPLEKIWPQFAFVSKSQ
jgi:hypothetical protein